MDHPVIDGESITVLPDEVTALIGPNGSGNSTLLKGLADKIDPDRGMVVVDEQDLESYGLKEVARKLGLFSPEHVSPEEISLKHHVERGRYSHTGFFESPGEEDQAAVDEAIKLAGIEYLRDREVGILILTNINS